jgi:hypothetical protein
MADCGRIGQCHLKYSDVVDDWGRDGRDKKEDGGSEHKDHADSMKPTKHNCDWRMDITVTVK